MKYFVRQRAIELDRTNKQNAARARRIALLARLHVSALALPALMAKRRARREGARP